jgi:hypothetical protein
LQPAVKRQSEFSFGIIKAAFGIPYAEANRQICCDRMVAQNQDTDPMPATRCSPAQKE